MYMHCLSQVQKIPHIYNERQQKIQKKKKMIQESIKFFIYFYLNGSLEIHVRFPMTSVLNLIWPAQTIDSDNYEQSMKGI